MKNFYHSNRVVATALYLPTIERTTLLFTKDFVDLSDSAKITSEENEVCSKAELMHLYAG